MDSTMMAGTSSVLREGSAGLKRITRVQPTLNGKAVGEATVFEEVVTPMVTRQVKEGTKALTVVPAPKKPVDPVIPQPPVKPQPPAAPEPPTTSEGPAGPGPTLRLSENSLPAGAQFEAVGDGFLPDENVSLFFHSTSLHLMDVQADSSGAFRVLLRVPAGTTVGAHKVYAVGKTSNRIVETPVTVKESKPAERNSSTQPSEVVSAKETASATDKVLAQRPTTPAKDLASTGASTIALTAFAALLLALGTSLKARRKF